MTIMLLFNIIYTLIYNTKYIMYDFNQRFYNLCTYYKVKSIINYFYGLYL